MIEFKAVSKTFAQKVALDSIDLKANKDKTTVLLGTSGCGKSTILKLIVELISPSRGQVFFEKQEVNSECVDEIWHQCSYVIQEGGLFPHLTARKNVTLMANYFGWNKSKTYARTCS